MKHPAIRLCTICFLLSAFVFSGCGSGEQEAPRAAASNRNIPVDVLRQNLGGEPETLDPALNTSLIGSRVLKGLMEGLVYLDGECKAQPAAAESWTHNDDYTVWTFNLRPEGKWHNGDPVTAHDFVHGVQRTLTPRLAAEYANIPASLLAGGEQYYATGGLNGDAPLPGIRADDDHTLVYTLRYPTPFFDTMIDLTFWFPAHRTTIETHGDSWYQKPETFVGNGPFRLAFYRSKDRIEIARADTYWDRKSIHWEKVIFYMIESLPTELQAFESGDIDITNKVSLAQLDRWRDKPEWSVAPNFGTYFLQFNTTVEPFDDVRVRKAFSKAIDRQLIVDRVTRRGETLGGGLVPEFLASPRGATYRDHAGDMVGEMDVQEARRLIAEAGFDKSNPLPRVEYVYDTADDHRAIGEQMQYMWREALGVDVRLQPVDWGTRLQRGKSGDFQIIRGGWYGDYLDAMTFLELYVTESPFNRPRFFNEEYDSLIEQARSEVDAARREDLLIAAERLLVEEHCAIAPLFTYSEPKLIRADLEGIVRNATGDLHYQRAWRVTK